MRSGPIELGIENYLLKPIKLEELKKTLGTASASLRQEAGTRKIQEKLLSLEQIFRSALLAELTVDENWRSMQKLPTALTATVPLPF